MRKIVSAFKSILILLWMILSACSSQQSAPLLELIAPEHSGIDFSNSLYEDENLNIITFEYFYNGAGVGIGDINNDGLQDIFFSGNMVDNRLYLNKGNFQFEDITPTSGFRKQGKWATGVAMVDINLDGYLDIYVCYAGPFSDPKRRANELYINNGDNTFSEKAAEYGLNDTGHSVQASFFDYDRDGDLDVYILTNTTDETGPNVIRPKRLNGEMINTDRLYRNNGNNTFTNVSAQSGITVEGYGLGVSVCDINTDGWPDVFVSNDYLSNDLLYVNNKDGTFTNRADQYFRHTSYSAMGNDAADFNNDGLVDLIEVDMLPPDNKRRKLMFGATPYDRYRSELRYGYTPQFMRNTLQMNRGSDDHGNPRFSEIGQLAGIHATDWSWSPLFADIDNDGWKDLLITNGYPRDITNRDFASYKAQEFVHEGYNESVKQRLLKAIESLDGAHLPNYAFKNNGNLTFSDQSQAWGFTEPSYSTGAAYADLDNDGDLDYITNNTNASASIFKNNAREKLKHHFLRMSLKGESNNPFGYGARVFLFVGQDSLQLLDQSPFRGFQSSVDQRLHAGLGNATHIDSLIVVWPDQRCQKLTDISVDRDITLHWKNAKDDSTRFPLQPKAAATFFSAVEDRNGIEYIHRESEYADFKIEPLLPHKYSQNGPGIAVADVNGDGKEDFFVGGAFKQSGQFFMQEEDGHFLTTKLTDQIKYEEDMGSLLFDSDNDGDNDLYIVSGGNEFQAGSSYYQHRLYANDGHGSFTLRRDAIPNQPSSGSCVVAADIEGDGDLDLFVGGRLSPHGYPTAGESTILQNDNGKFTDVTNALAPGLKNIGMVTAGLWTDVNNDSKVDLMVVGEWMPISVFINREGKLLHSPNAIPNSSGWWNSIAGSDFDSDGDTDYIVGNLGFNSNYKATVEEPVSVYISDLNNDGVRDPILSHFIQGVNRPAHPRDDILIQASSLKKKYPSYVRYAETTVGELFENAKPSLLSAHTFATTYLENNGAGQWKLHQLPVTAQTAPVYGIVTGEFTDDEFLDAILVGNFFSSDVLTGQYDAFSGLLLKGEGNGNFIAVDFAESGFDVKGDGKGLALLNTAAKKTLVLAAQNNDRLCVFEHLPAQTKAFTPEASDFYVLVEDKAGRKRKHEFYYGSGYLSQSSRAMLLQPNVSLTLFDYAGKAKKIILE